MIKAEALAMQCWKPSPSVALSHSSTAFLRLNHRRIKAVASEPLAAEFEDSQFVEKVAPIFVIVLHV
jgi:hypothetical protein